MLEQQTKYSLWIVPKGDVGYELQHLINTLSDTYNTPKFVPHITVVGNLTIHSGNAYADLVRHIYILVKHIRKFNITLTHLEHLDEEFRSLFLSVEPSTKLDELFKVTSELFPHVNDEKFRAMPHMSVLYGKYDSHTKTEIIKKYDNPDNTNITFEIDSLELFQTNLPVDKWHHDQSFPFKKARY